MPNRQRTPGDMPGEPQYGQSGVMETATAAAARTAAQTPPRVPAPESVNAARPKPIPLFAPTEFPEEPITAGAPFGAGPGAAPTTDPRMEDLRKLKQYIPIMETAATRLDAPDSLKRFVRFLRTVT